MFKGSMVALVTPMQADGTIDKSALNQLIEWHISAGTTALIIAGTTGESATLDPNEQFDLIESAVKQARGRIPIIAGSGSNATKKTIELTQQAKRAGAAACLIVTPYYNKPTQEGLYQHYAAVAQQVDIPIILYNVPGRTGCDLLPETVERLAKIKHIIGIKEATGNLDRTRDILARCGQAFDIYSGDDATAMELMLLGAQGVISVTANIAPKLMAEMCQAALMHDRKTAEALNAKLDGLHHKLFVEANPIPAKWALFTMGKVGDAIRMPLLPLDKRFHQEVQAAMQQAGVL